jgi:hypothetical protein
MIKMNISVDNDILQQFQMALARVGAGNFPLVAHAMNIEVERIAEQWRDFAQGGELKGVKPLTRPDRSYLFGVKSRQLGPFDYEIFNESKAARRIEEGTPELDMKTTHPYGPKSRISKKGVPYLIIPFGWGTPGTKRNPRVGFRNVMPEQVYNIVKKFKKFKEMKTLIPADSLVNANITPNGGYTTYNLSPNPRAGAGMVIRAQYNKGYGRLSGMDFAGTVEEKTRMDGMVRVDAKGESAKEYGNYLTFRVISAGSPSGSWIRPRVDPRPVVQTLADEARGPMNAAVESAIKGELHDILSE